MLFFDLFNFHLFYMLEFVYICLNINFYVFLYYVYYH